MLENVFIYIFIEVTGYKSFTVIIIDEILRVVLFLIHNRPLLVWIGKLTFWVRVQMSIKLNHNEY